MKSEYEIAVLDINVDKVKEKLVKLGAEFKGENHQRRYTYNIDKEYKGRFMRLRTNGYKTTLTIKDKSLPKEIGSVKELEMEVQDFSLANEFLETLGYNHTFYQENIKTVYLLNDVEISIEQWPMIPPYLEIEGKSKEAVEEMIEMLEINKDKLTLSKVSEIYKKYNLDIHEYKNLDFNSEPNYIKQTEG